MSSSLLLLLGLLLVHNAFGCLPGNQVTIDNGNNDVTNPPPNPNTEEKDPGAGDINNTGDLGSTQGPIQTGGPTGTGTTGGDVCGAVQCTFEQNTLCQYKTNGKPATPDIPATSARLKRQAAGQYNELAWVPHSGRFGNRNTGVPKAGDNGGQYFAGAFMQKSGDIAVLSADLASPLAGPQTVTFDFWENTQDLVLKSCCDATCNPVSDPNAHSDKRVWQQSTLNCPAGTKQISFRCENSGSNDGSCAVDNIKVGSCPPPQ